MAYAIQTERLIPGGLNLLAPSDAGAAGDCLALNDWWPGALGRLEQTQQASNIYGGSNINSIQKAAGRIYWAGGGTVHRDGSYADTGWGPETVGMLGYQGYCWMTNRTKQRKDDGTVFSDWTIAGPTAAVALEDGGTDGSTLSPPAYNPPLVGGLLDQPYTYYATWMTTTGETNPSPAATLTPAVTGSIIRVHQPASAPGTATGWNVYREVGGIPYLLNEDGPLPLSRLECDDYGDEIHTQSDVQMLALGIIMEGDHDPPPPAAIMADTIYNERIVVASSAANPNRIWFTQARQPGFFRGASNNFDGDWLDVGADPGDAVLAITAAPTQLIIYRMRSIWRHIGDFGDANARLEVVVPDMGIAGPRAAVATSLGSFFVGNQTNPGVFKFNGDWAQKLSQKVDPIFRGQTAGDAPVLGYENFSHCSIGFINGRLWVGYPTVSDTFPLALIYYLETERWFSATQGYRAFLDAGDQFLGGQDDGLYQLETSTLSESNPIYQSQYVDCGLPDHEKTWADLVLHYNTQGWWYDLTIRLNKGTDADHSFLLATFSSSSITKRIFPLVYPGTYPDASKHGLPIRSYNLSVRISADIPVGGSPAGTFETPILLHYYLEARRAMSFDTDETDHGLEGAKRVDQVEIDIDATSGSGTLQILSDIPGGVMAPRLGPGQTIAATTGRQSVKLVLPAPVDGKLLRYAMTTANEFQVYKMRVRLLPLPQTLDGTVGDVWQCEPISVGV